MISSPHEVILEKAIGAAALRHKVIANNIANVNTPLFKRSEVLFEEQLQQALTSNQNNTLPLTVTHQNHLQQQPVNLTLSPEVKQVLDNSLRTDGNNVDIDIETANMAKNNIYYDATIQQINRYYSTIKSVIQEGRR